MGVEQPSSPNGHGGGEAEPGGPTWLAALDAADDVFLRELVVHGPPPQCTPSEEAEAAFYDGLGEATRPFVGLRAAHPALRLRAARDAAALKLDVGDARGGATRTSSRRRGALL